MRGLQALLVLQNDPNFDFRPDQFGYRSMALQGWATLHGWQLDRTTSAPLFRQIYRQVRSCVLTGVLAPGAKLPSTRALASELGAARASVVAAYELLLAEGSATESFIDHVDRMHFSNWAEHEALGEAAPMVEMPYPRALANRQVPLAVRRMIEARATQFAAAA